MHVKQNTSDKIKIDIGRTPTFKVVTGNKRIIRNFPQNFNFPPHKSVYSHYFYCTTKVTTNHYIKKTHLSPATL